MAILVADGSDMRRGYAWTLGWYLAQRWLTVLMLTLLALAAFIYLMDVVDLLKQVSGRNVRATTALMMSLTKVPDLLMQLLPFGVLLASLVWVNQLNRWHELVALRASGLPARRVILGPLLACALVGVTSLTVLNPVAASLLKRYERWYGEVFPNQVKGLVTAGGNIWLRQQEDGKTFFIYGKSVAATGARLDEATVFVFDTQGDFVARLDAKTANLEKGQWKLDEVVMLSPTRKIVREVAVTLPTTLTPQQIQASFNPPGTLDVFELKRFIGVLEKSGFPASRHAMAYQRLLAMPATGMAMLLLAVPFGLRFTRGRGLATVVMAGLGLGFGFYLFGNIVAAYGLAGRLDVGLAAWLPALMAVLLAAALLLYLREE